MPDTPAPATPKVSFAALRTPGFRAFLATYFLAMMADNIEHVISYWMAYQKFHSAALGGFAVVSHWLPFLLFSVPAGALADRFDPRRLNQFGMLLFMTASLGWGYFFITDTLQMWQAMLLLVIHGCAGVFWQTSSQILIHDIVTRDLLPSAVRLNATARTLGVLVGPAVGGVIMLTLGPKHGILLNACFYLPVILWMWKAPYGPRFRKGAPAPQRAVRGWADVRQTFRDIAERPLLVSMIQLAGGASFFIGNSYQAQMPNFAQDLGHGDPGVSYSALLAADAAGALTAGFLLERWGLLKPNPRTAVLLAMGWCISLGSFAMAHAYPLALTLLFCAGMCELSYNSMTQTLVQLNAPAEIRGRVIGVFNMCAMGMRTFSGVTVGLVGTIAGVHWSLGLSALVMLCVLLLLRRRLAVAHAV
jgi:MFS family permease